MHFWSSLLSWLCDPGAPAWVQAVGSVIAVLIAVWIPARQRRNSLRDASTDRQRQEKEHLKRLTTGLRAEIDAALEWTKRRQQAIEPVLKGLQDARASGVAIKREPIQPGSIVVTDAIVYRAIASELGRLPPELIRSVVLFYTLALDLGRIADGAPTAEEAYKNLHSNVPRLKMHAALLTKTLDKLEACGFMVDADVRPKPDEIRDLAIEVGYPIDQVMRERGIQAQTVFDGARA
jgi:hypothetical protein